MKIAGLRSFAENLLRAKFVAIDVQQRAARKGRRDGKRVPDQSRSRRLRLETADLAAAADKSVVRTDLMVSNLAGAEAIAQDQFAVGNDAAADPRAQREQHEIARAAAHAVGVFAQRRAARVVADETGISKCERSVSPSGTFIHLKPGL